MPHHKLIAYQIALELVRRVGAVRIRDSQLRQIAGALGACSQEDVAAVLALGVRLKNLLSRLVR